MSGWKNTCYSSLYSEQETIEQHPHSNEQFGRSFLSSKDGEGEKGWKIKI